MQCESCVNACCTSIMREKQKVCSWSTGKSNCRCIGSRRLRSCKSCCTLQSRPVAPCNRKAVCCHLCADIRYTCNIPDQKIDIDRSEYIKCKCCCTTC